MYFSLTVFVSSFVVLLACVGSTEIPATAVAVRIPAHKDECFFEDVPSAGVKVYLHYIVTSGGALDIDASVYGPDQELIWAAEKERESRVLFKTRLPGIHKVCFSNKMSTLTSKVVGFNIQVGDPADSTKEHEVDPMERSIVHVAMGLNDIKSEQVFLRTRERIHRDTSESTNTRVLLWSIGEIALICFMGVGHVW
eukprot:CAMPEP_0176424336 /NCGR_PEP_ID=MMETSP0127-20121128/10783_1 /TAXON_ID=938130 /ORGANISM="Platyophrya macrostoma, Strain WH" /LENGTH=195 /DNA_ID=CAMNT_0017805387 /DNA_START=30 /DNA_END=614 /DNA_ORIENTATION=-